MSRHIAHIVQRMAPGGLEVLALELARQLPERNSIISLEGVSENLVEAWPRLGGVSPNLVGMDKKAGLDVKLFMRLRTLFQKLGVDTIVTHHAGPFVYAGPAARLAGIRNIVHVEHDVWHYQSPRRRRLMQSFATVVRPKIVGVAERLRQPLQDVFGEEPTIIPNGVDLTKFVENRVEARARLRVDLSTRVVGAAGRLEHVKGHDILIEAFAKLPSDVLLVIAGDGSLRSALEAQARNLFIADRVRFLGHRDDVGEIYGAFDVFCQPSRNEGLPLAVLEAQACGAPVVATQVGDLASGVCPMSGKVVAPESPDALATALRDALDRSDTPSPRRFVAERFNWQHTLAGYKNILGV